MLEMPLILLIMLVAKGFTAKGKFKKQHVRLTQHASTDYWNAEHTRNLLHFLKRASRHCCQIVSMGRSNLNGFCLHIYCNCYNLRLSILSEFF